MLLMLLIRGDICSADKFFCFPVNFAINCIPQFRSVFLEIQKVIEQILLC